MEMPAARPALQWEFDGHKATLYHEVMEPAMFALYAGPLVDLARLQPGDRVLDAACGTGVVARKAAEEVGAAGWVSGCDITPSMLAIAREEMPSLDWREGDIADLPYEDGTFNAVICQMALMMVPDPAQVLREFRRVAVPGGSIVISVNAGSDEFRRYGEIIARIAGPQAAQAAAKPFSMADPGILSGLLDEAGLEIADDETVEIASTFPSLESFLTTVLGVSPLSGLIPVQTLIDAAADHFADCITPTGQLQIHSLIRMTRAITPRP